MTAVSPANGLTQLPPDAEVMIQFNEPVDMQMLGQVTLSATSGAVPVLASLSNGNQILNLMTLVTLRPNTAYTLNISGVTDLSGISAMIPVTPLSPPDLRVTSLCLKPVVRFRRTEPPEWRSLQQYRSNSTRQ